MFTKDANGRNLRFENLETRRLMAGDVDVSLHNNGNLDIEGDHHHDGNQIEMYVVQFGNQANDRPFYSIRGLDGTTINGRQEVLVPVDNVTGDINVELGHYDDSIDIYAFWTDNDLNIETGRGDDDVHIKDVIVGYQLNIDTGADDDFVWVSDAEIGHESRGDRYPDLVVNTGHGRVDNLWMRDISVLGDTYLTSGTGINVYFVQNADLAGDLNIRGRSGNDFVYLFDTNVKRDVDMNLGSNHDFVFMDNLKVRGDFTLNTSWGNDFVFGRQLEVRGQASFKGGWGRHDHLKLVDSVFADLENPVGFEGVQIV